MGSCGREDVLVTTLAKSPSVTELWCTPGSDAIALERLASNGSPVRRLKFEPTEVRQIVAAAMHYKIDLVVPGPESCLEAGLGDECRKAGIPFVGPCSRGARFETSKAFSHEFCWGYSIPRAPGQICYTLREAWRVARFFFENRCAIKADGPAQGKGTILCHTEDEVDAALQRIMVQREFGRAGDCAVIQQLLKGEEISLHILADRHRALLLETARDYKRVGTGDTGLMTGGMGGYSPGPLLDARTSESIENDIIAKWRAGCAAEEILYRGILYPGLMLTDLGPRVLEFNARFGDPETEVLMRRFEGDLAELLYASATDSLRPEMLKWSPEPAVCVVLASRGYPGRPELEKEIFGLSDAETVSGVQVFHMGTKLVNGKWYTNGGRVLAVTARGTNLMEARERAYAGVKCIQFDGMHYRSDIADVACV